MEVKAGAYTQRSSDRIETMMKLTMLLILPSVVADDIPLPRLERKWEVNSRLGSLVLRLCRCQPGWACVKCIAMISHENSPVTDEVHYKLVAEKLRSCFVGRADRNNVPS